MTDIEIEIDGQKLTAKPNQMVIEVADAAGIYIPRFCYHKHLSIAANCRMCLVEVEKSPKTLPACATPVMAGMKVFTKSPKTIEAQRAVMEFLLINHPLDCPVCDQGGECELQDISMGYGSSWSHYDECKRSVADENLGPLIETEMTRCIQCTRCVRFGEEVAGIRELGVTYRGEHEEISTFVSASMTSEVSGNIIDLCPVGALTSKPYRFTARAWELEQAPSVSPHDCLGTNINVHTRTGKVMRVVSRENPAINETWIADRDRFSYTGLYHADRLEEPMARVNGHWQTVSWERALQLAAAGLQDVIRDHGAAAVGALISPNSTTEECYLTQKLMRAMGSSNIDHRLREVDTRDQTLFPLFPGSALTLSELEQCDAILLIGSNIQKEQPLVALRLRQAQKQGAVIVAMNPVDYQFNFHVNAKAIVAPHALASTLESTLDAIKRQDTTNTIVKVLQGKTKAAIIVGALAHHDQHAAAIRYQVQSLTAAIHANTMMLTSGANAAGAWIAGAVPHRTAFGESANAIGLSAHEMLKQGLRGYLLLNVEPDLDAANSAEALLAMQQADCIVALTMYRHPALLEHAHVMLPVTPFTETSGTFVNVFGQWQHFKGVATPYAESRPAWKVLRVLGNFLHAEGFDYESSNDVIDELNSLKKNSVNENKSFSPIETASRYTLSRIGEIPIYSGDSLVRRAAPLQEAQPIVDGAVDQIRVHPATALQLGLQAGQSVTVKQAKTSTALTVQLDERIAQGAIWMAGGVSATVGSGDLFGELTIHV